MAYWTEKKAFTFRPRMTEDFPRRFDDSTPARIEVSKLPRELASYDRWIDVASGRRALRRQPDHFDPNTGG